MEFNVTCNMKERWVPHFLGMLRKMEQLGDVGSSDMVGMYSDGDGDYRPKFSFDVGLAKPAKSVSERHLATLINPESSDEDVNNILSNACGWEQFPENQEEECMSCGTKGWRFCRPCVIKAIAEKAGQPDAFVFDAG